MANNESIYRTKWLMAHNRLHDLVHKPDVDKLDSWQEYLEELETAEAIADVEA